MGEEWLTSTHSMQGATFILLLQAAVLTVYNYFQSYLKKVPIMQVGVFKNLTYLGLCSTVQISKIAMHPKLVLAATRRKTQ